MTKWDRMLKRKQARDSFNASNHERKIKQQNDGKPKRWKRRENGAWILFETIKITKVGIFLLCALGAIGLYILIGLNFF